MKQSWSDHKQFLDVISMKFALFYHPNCRCLPWFKPKFELWSTRSFKWPSHAFVCSFFQIEYQVGESETTSASKEQEVSLHANVQGVLRKAEAGLKHSRKQGTEKQTSRERYKSEMVVRGHAPDPDTLVIPRADSPAMLSHVLRPICDVIPLKDWTSELKSICKGMFRSEAFCFSQLPDAPNPDNGNTETLEFLFEAKKHFQCGEAAIPMVGYKIDTDSAVLVQDPRLRSFVKEQQVTTQWECAMTCMNSSRCAVASFADEKCQLCDLEELPIGRRRKELKQIVRNEHCLASIIPCGPNMPCSIFVRKMSQALQEEMPRENPPIIKNFHLGIPLFQASRVIGDVIGRNTLAVRIHKEQNKIAICDFYREHTLPDERVVPSEVMNGYATGFAMKCMQSRPDVAADGLAVRIHIEAKPCFAKKKPETGKDRSKRSLSERNLEWLKSNLGQIHSMGRTYQSALAGEDFEENNDTHAVAGNIIGVDQPLQVKAMTSSQEDFWSGARRFGAFFGQLFFGNDENFEEAEEDQPKVNATDTGKSGKQLLGYLQWMTPISYFTGKVLYKQATTAYNYVHHFLYPPSDHGKHTDDPEPEYVRIVGTCDFYDASQVMIEHRNLKFCERDKYCNMKNGQFFKTRIFELQKTTEWRWIILSTDIWLQRTNSGSTGIGGFSCENVIQCLFGPCPFSCFGIRSVRNKCFCSVCMFVTFACTLDSENHENMSLVFHIICSSTDCWLVPLSAIVGFNSAHTVFVFPRMYLSKATMHCHLAAQTLPDVLSCFRSDQCSPQMESLLVDAHKFVCTWQYPSTDCWLVPRNASIVFYSVHTGRLCFGVGFLVCEFSSQNRERVNLCFDISSSDCSFVPRCAFVVLHCTCGQCNFAFDCRLYISVAFNSHNRHKCFFLCFTAFVLQLIVDWCKNTFVLWNPEQDCICHFVACVCPMSFHGVLIWKKKGQDNIFCQLSSEKQTAPTFEMSFPQRKKFLDKLFGFRFQIGVTHHWRMASLHLMVMWSSSNKVQEAGTFISLHLEIPAPHTFSGQVECRLGYLERFFLKFRLPVRIGGLPVRIEPLSPCPITVVECNQQGNGSKNKVSKWLNEACCFPNIFCSHGESRKVKKGESKVVTRFLLFVSESSGCGFCLRPIIIISVLDAMEISFHLFLGYDTITSVSNGIFGCFCWSKVTEMLRSWKMIRLISLSTHYVWVYSEIHCISFQVLCLLTLGNTDISPLRIRWGEQFELVSPLMGIECWISMPLQLRLLTLGNTDNWPLRIRWGEQFFASFPFDCNWMWISTLL